MEFGINKKPDISTLCIYGCNVYIVDYKAKVKGKIAFGSLDNTLLAIKLKISREFGIIPEFLSEKMLILISLGFNIKTSQAQNQWKKTLVLILLL